MAKKKKIVPFKSDLPAASLAFALLGAAHAAAHVEKGTALTASLSKITETPSVTPQAAGAIQDIAYRVMRKLGLTRQLLKKMTNKLPESVILRNLLYCSLALLSDPDKDNKLPYEPYTIVDQSVTAASSFLPRYKNLVNAVLRRFLREKDFLLGEVNSSIEAVWNYPLWWINATRTAYPQKWEEILKIGNTTPPLSLRVNQRKITTKSYLDLLQQEKINAYTTEYGAVILEKPLPVSQIPGFSQGLVSVQDAAAQYAASLLDLHDGMSVLDACAAPGGKTGHILETANVQVLALDQDPLRLKRIEENMRRLQLQADIKQGDASKQNWWNGIPFDRILADVPCTASGIMRRHPDIRWLRKSTDIDQLTTLSAQILDNLWQMLRPNGKLLFVTCSIWPEESEMQAKAFALRNNAKRLPAPGQLLPETSRKKNHDGLFYALFEKSIAS